MGDVHLERGITVQPEGAGSLVTLWGEIDASLRNEASAVIRDVVSRGGAVVIDLSDVVLADSSALAFILQLHRICDESGEPCTVRKPPPAVVELLEVIGMERMIQVELSPAPRAGPAGHGPARARPGTR